MPREHGPSNEAIDQLKDMIGTDKERLRGRLKWNELVRESDREPPPRGSRRTGKIYEVFRAFEAE